MEIRLNTTSSQNDIDPILVAWPWLVGTWTLFLIALSGWLSVGFPHPTDGDSSWYLPPMLHYHQSGQLINPYFGVNYTQAEDGRFTWHGFLFPMVGSLLMPWPSYIGVSWAQFFMQAISLVFGGILLIRQRVLEWSSGLARLMMLAVLGASLQSFAGRPDLLVCLWAMLGTLLYCSFPQPSAKMIVAGSTIGLVAATSPLPALFLSLLFLGTVSVEFPWREAFFRSAKTGAIALLVFAATFLIYPYDFSQWIAGVLTQAHASEGARHLGFTGFLAAWLADDFGGSQPLALFWCAPPVILACYYLLTGQVQWLPGLIFSMLAILILIVLIAPDVRKYNVTCLLPVFFIPWLKWLQDQSPHQPKGFPPQALSWIVIAAALITFLPIVREALIRPHVAKGMSRVEAIKLIAELRQTHPRVDVTNGLFSLFENPDDLRIVRFEGKEVILISYPGKGNSQIPGETLIVQQINPFRPVPPEIPHYRLVKSYFGDFSRWRIAGLKLANSPRGYNFAVYERVPRP